jgi:putative transposase
MSIRPVPLVPTEFFHIYNRGTDKRTIYSDDADRRRFLELLYLCNSNLPINVRDVRKVQTSVYDFERGDKLVSIGAYCLMPNHFHILITSQIEGGITTFMSKVSTGYSMYFNKRYARTGALFQGKFKSQHADSDEYLKYLYAYIHLNPVKLIDKDWKERGSKDAVKSFDFAASYAYSSLPDYLGRLRLENKILDPAPFPDYFAAAADHQTELFEWLTYSDELSLGKA